ncbi:hypothetical protein IV38_GL000268 [Lactobacillus selangorensis]|uniref:Uncharacterized protein n=1 Tax=Lactobacillus selangorensis TaxID=81857 RepID=A0A0R2G941_9LACO|nr:hypothetical protein [Lactobacillus selangorensis]KRN29384.1 hypothetical protein IV38_GL000268 [Lactobacillus selangorensis]KRN34087.1 hypothetical protein IV40_GL000401 [Lactobacillus selangorensis]
MTIIIGIILCLVVLGLILWFAVRRLRRNRALKILKAHSEKLTDQVVHESFPELVQQYPHWAQPQTLLSNPVEDIWGRGVMVFEYQAQVTSAKVSAVEIMHALEKLLNQNAQKAHIDSSNQKYKPFIVSDGWYLDDQFHFDVAFMTNQPTIDYVQDMRRLDLKDDILKPASNKS